MGGMLSGQVPLQALMSTGGGMGLNASWGIGAGMSEYECQPLNPTKEEHVEGASLLQRGGAV